MYMSPTLNRPKGTPVDEFLKTLPGGIGTIAAIMAAFFGVFTLAFPKLMNAMKVDKQESEALKRIDVLEKRSFEQSELIHKVQVKFTKAISALIAVRSWHIGEGHALPPHIKEAFAELLDEKHE